VPGSNGRPPACKARAAAAVYCGLSLSPLGERGSAPGCCGLLQFAASTVLPHDAPAVTRKAKRVRSTSETDLPLPDLSGIKGLSKRLLGGRDESKRFAQMLARERIEILWIHVLVR
jgi:hypothetical protein